MKQGNGMDLLGPNEPRGTEVGIIYVSPTDDRQSVLAAILTQEKLGRKQVAIVLSRQNKAFQSPKDLDDLKSWKRKLHTQVVFIVPSGPGPAEWARQRRFEVYSTLENYASALQAEFQDNDEQQKKSWLFGSARFKNGAAKNAEQGEPQPVAQEHGVLISQSQNQGNEQGDDIVQPLAQSSPDGAGGKQAFPSTPPPSGPVELPGEHSIYDTSFDEDSLPNHHDEDDYALPASDTSANKAPAFAVGAFAASATPPSQGGGGGPEPNIIELPVRGRNTLKLPPRPDLDEEPAPRNTGKMAAASMAGAALAARSGGGQPPTRGNIGSGGGGGGNRPPRRAGRFWWLAALLIFLTVLVVGGTVVVLAYSYPNSPLGPLTGILPRGGPAATVTITPDNKVIANSYVILAVPEKADAAQQQILARQLSTTQKQTRTIKSTGHNKTPGVSASGILTFKNGSGSSQTIPAGQTIPLGNGVTIVTSAQVRIPPANLATGFVGVATVSARASAVGPAGNIAAGTINQYCCAANNTVYVSNADSFNGGQDPKDYDFVKQGDYDTAVSALTSQLTRQSNDNLATQVKASEQLADASSCPATVNASNKVGDQGVNVSTLDVTVSVTCKAVAYDQSGMRSIVMNRLQAKASQDLGTGYALQNNILIHSRVQAINKDNSVSLLVDARGLWIYQFPEDQKAQLTKQIAGQSVDQARTLLKAQKGVSNVNIAANGNTLPTDVTQIAIVIQNIAPIKDFTPTPVTIPTPPGGPAQNTPQPGNG